MGKIGEKEFVATVNYEKSAYVVVCPVCGVKYYGNAIHYAAMTGGAISCGTNGCQAVLRPVLPAVL